MSNYWPGVITDIENAINTSWPDITFIAEVPDFDKYDWEDLQRQGQEAFPFALFYMPGFGPSDINPMSLSWYQMQISIYYVGADSAVPGTPILTTIRAKLAALDGFLRETGLTSMQLTNAISGNWDPKNEVNSRLQAQKLPATAGELTFTAIIPSATIP